ncbi:MAG: zinc-ribbon domain-containing protein [Limisphaerales bacterium]
MTPETCPNCGADVPSGARACPGCGADEKTGWSEEAYASSLNLPDESFDYDEFTEREFGKKKVRPYGVKWFWWVVAIVLAVLFILGLVKLIG